MLKIIFSEISAAVEKIEGKGVLLTLKRKKLLTVKR